MNLTPMTSVLVSCNVSVLSLTEFSTEFSIKPSSLVYKNVW